MGVARAETCLPSAVLAIVLPDATLAAPMPAASTLAIASGLYTCRQPVQRRGPHACLLRIPIAIATSRVACAFLSTATSVRCCR
jgi:hypothetical protein